MWPFRSTGQILADLRKNRDAVQPWHIGLHQEDGGGIPLHVTADFSKRVVVIRAGEMFGVEMPLDVAKRVNAELAQAIDAVAKADEIDITADLEKESHR